MPHMRPRTVKSISRFEALGQSEAFLEFQEQLSNIAPVNRPVLLIGERGTGKELAAARLHYLSSCWQGPFITLNCAALTPSLIESELFGYERGAFTGAQQRRIGRFESANGGTLFLDEIGSIPLEVQEKILRVVEYGVFERVGSSDSVEVDVRIIGATNADLTDLSEKGRFKRDLLDRLSFEVLFVPPLRERKGDILFLANHFAQRMAFELERQDMPLFSDETAGSLEAYPWNGNIRELKNVVERAVYRSESNLITEIVFSPFHALPKPGGQEIMDENRVNSKEKTAYFMKFTDMPLKAAVENLEIYLVRRALEKTRYNQKKAARRLGLTYDQFRGLRRKHTEKIDSRDDTDTQKSMSTE